MSLLKQRNIRLLFLVAAALLMLLASSLILTGNTVYKSWCICLGQWSEGICHTDWYNSSLQAPSPICRLRGVQSEEWICIGSWESVPIYTGVGTVNDVTCHGLEIDLGQCYGLPYSASSDDNGGPISCNYPCDDEQILEACKTNDVVKFDRVTVSCAQLERWCRFR